MVFISTNDVMGPSSHAITLLFEKVMEEQLIMADLGMSSVEEAEQAVHLVAKRQPVHELLTYLECLGQPFVAAVAAREQESRRPRVPPTV
jgi:hypothetical protein